MCLVKDGSRVSSRAYLVRSQLARVPFETSATDPSRDLQGVRRYCLSRAKTCSKVGTKKGHLRVVDARLPVSFSSFALRWK
jgi:hypothetical protein